MFYEEIIKLFLKNKKLTFVSLQSKMHFTL